MTIDPSGTRDRTGSSLLGQMSDCSGLKGVKQLCRPQACQPSIGDHFPPQCINIHLLVPLWVILVWPGANMWFLGRLNCFVGASMSALRTCPAWLGLADGGVLRVRHHLLEIRSYSMVYLLMCLAGNELRQQGQCDFLTEGDDLCSGIGCCRDSAIDAVILPRSEATEAHESAISQLQPACV